MSVPHIAIQSIHGLFTVKVGGILIHEIRPDDDQLLSRLPPYLAVPGMRFVLVHYAHVSRRDTALMGPAHLAAFYNRAAAATACNMIAAAMVAGAHNDFGVCDIREWEIHGRAEYENSYEENRRVYEQQQRLRRGPNQRSIDLGDAAEATANHQDDLNAIMRTPGPLEARQARYEDIFGVEPGSIQPHQRSRPRQAVGTMTHSFADEQRALREEARFEAEQQAQQQEMVQAAQQAPLGIVDRGVGQDPGFEGPPGAEGFSDPPGPTGPPGEAEEASGYSRIYPAGGGMLLMAPDGTIAQVVGAATDVYHVGDHLPAGTLFTTIDGQSRRHTEIAEDLAVSQSRPVEVGGAGEPDPPLNPFMLNPNFGRLVEVIADCIHPYTSTAQQNAIREQMGIEANVASLVENTNDIRTLANYLMQRWQYRAQTGMGVPHAATIGTNNQETSRVLGAFGNYLYDVMPVLVREQLVREMRQHEDLAVRHFVTGLERLWAIEAEARATMPAVPQQGPDPGIAGRELFGGNRIGPGRSGVAVNEGFVGNTGPGGGERLGPGRTGFQGPTGFTGTTGPVGATGVAGVVSEELDRAVDTDRPVRDVNRGEENRRRIFGPPDTTRRS